jgi:hypothetical protein
MLAVITVLITTTCLSANPPSETPAAPEKQAVNEGTGIISPLPGTVSNIPDFAAAVSPATSATVVSEPAAEAAQKDGKDRKDKKDGKNKHWKRGKQGKGGFDYGFIFLPVRRQYVVEDLSTGKYTTAHQDYSKKAGTSWFIYGAKDERKKGRRLYDRVFGGFGYAGASYSMAGSERVRHADAVSDRNLRRDEDRISDDVSSLMFAAGFGKGYARKNFDAFLGWRAGLWPTIITTRITEARWPADGSAPVKLATADTRVALLGELGLVFDMALIRVGSLRLGLDGRLGYVGAFRAGTAPNDLIGMVGVTPEDVGTQFVLGGTYWYAGLKLF